MVSDKFLHLGQHLRLQRLRYVAKHEYGCATFTLHFVFDWLPCNIYNHAGKIAATLHSFSFHLLSESPHLALCTSVPWLKGRIQSEPSVTSARHPGGLKYFLAVTCQKHYGKPLLWPARKLAGCPNPFAKKHMGMSQNEARLFLL